MLTAFLPHGVMRSKNMNSFLRLRFENYLFGRDKSYEKNDAAILDLECLELAKQILKKHPYPRYHTTLCGQRYFGSIQFFQKILQIGQLYLLWHKPHLTRVFRKIRHIMYICIYRVWQKTFLQLQKHLKVVYGSIPHKYNIFFHIFQGLSFLSLVFL